MTKVNYAFGALNEHVASAYGRSLHISTKASINICKALRHKPVDKAVAYLDRVIAKTQAIPFTRFTDGVGHRRGQLAAGRFPIKAAQEIKSLVQSAAANAENKGFSEDLKIVHICAHKAATPFSQGRNRRSTKRTHIEVVVQEYEKKEKPVAKAKPAPIKKEKATAPKAETKKPEVKPQATPAAKEEPKATEAKVETKPEAAPQDTKSSQKTTEGNSQ